MIGVCLIGAGRAGMIHARNFASPRAARKNGCRCRSFPGPRWIAQKRSSPSTRAIWIIAMRWRTKTYKLW